MSMKNLLSFFRARLSEPSTLSGLAAVGVLFGLPEGAINATVQVAVAACSVLAVVMPEKSGK